MTTNSNGLTSPDMLPLEEKQLWTETTTRHSVSPSRLDDRATHPKQSLMVSEIEHSYSQSVTSESAGSSIDASPSVPAESVCSVESHNDAPVRSAESATDFWTQYLTGAIKCRFPAIEKDDSEEVGLEELVFVDHTAVTSLCKSTGVSVSGMMMAVWAVVLHGHTLLEEVCFGYGFDPKGHGLYRTPISKNRSLSDIARQFDVECQLDAQCIHLDHKQFFNTFVSIRSNEQTEVTLPELLPVSISGRNVASIDNTY